MALFRQPASEHDPDSSRRGPALDRAARFTRAETEGPHATPLSPTELEQAHQQEGLEEKVGRMWNVFLRQLVRENRAINFSQLDSDTLLEKLAQFQMLNDYHKVLRSLINERSISHYLLASGALNREGKVDERTKELAEKALSELAQLLPDGEFSRDLNVDNYKSLEDGDRYTAFRSYAIAHILQQVIGESSEIYAQFRQILAQPMESTGQANAFLHDVAANVGAISGSAGTILQYYEQDTQQHPVDLVTYVQDPFFAKQLMRYPAHFEELELSCEVYASNEVSKDYLRINQTVDFIRARVSDAAASKGLEATIDVNIVNPEGLDLKSVRTHFNKYWVVRMLLGNLIPNIFKAYQNDEALKKNDGRKPIHINFAVVGNPQVPGEFLLEVYVHDRAMGFPIDVTEEQRAAGNRTGQRVAADAFSQQRIAEHLQLVEPTGGSAWLNQEGESYAQGTGFGLLAITEDLETYASKATIVCCNRIDTRIDPETEAEVPHIDGATVVAKFPIYAIREWTFQPAQVLSFLKEASLLPVTASEKQVTAAALGSQLKKTYLGSVTSEGQVTLPVDKMGEVFNIVPTMTEVTPKQVALLRALSLDLPNFPRVDALKTPIREWLDHSGSETELIEILNAFNNDNLQPAIDKLLIVEEIAGSLGALWRAVREQDIADVATDPSFDTLMKELTETYTEIQQQLAGYQQYFTELASSSEKEDQELAISYQRNLPTLFSYLEQARVA